MAANNLTKKLIAAGITANTDGLLRDLIARGMFYAALDTIDAAIERRNVEAVFLGNFRHVIMQTILDEQEV